MQIVCNQVGFLPAAPKRVIFLGGEKNVSFKVIRAQDYQTVFEGVGDGYGDFSALQDEGRYYIRTGDGTESCPFSIGSDVYDGLLTDAVRMMYLQRCGTVLEEKYAGEFAHGLCHMEKALIYGTDQRIDVSGGWHDAGDYGRYVVAAAVTAAHMLTAYELAPKRFGDDTNIPESHNKTPDILDEVRYCLDWMFKMQSPEGGAYHKVTCASFPGAVMPEEEKDELIVCPVSKTATGDFAAVMALAGRIYTEWDPAFAEKCVKAAVRAWDFLIAGGGAEVMDNPPGIQTGVYGDKNSNDERYWAAAELYRTTGEKAYRLEFEKMAAEKIYKGFGWGRVGHMGNLAYLRMPGAETDPELRKKIRAFILEEAKTYVEVSSRDEFGSAVTRYRWGSNMDVLFCGCVMLLAAEEDSDPALSDSAMEQLSFVLGQNPTGMCYVTGYGQDSPVKPHHRPSMVVGKPFAGMLVGGPDEGRNDALLKEKCEEASPAMCYVDEWGSYASNEVDTYWNASLILMLAFALA